VNRNVRKVTLLDGRLLELGRKIVQIYQHFLKFYNGFYMRILKALLIYFEKIITCYGI